MITSPYVKYGTMNTQFTYLGCGKLKHQPWWADVFVTGFGERGENVNLFTLAS